MDLTQVEGVADLLAAETAMQHRLVCRPFCSHLAITGEDIFNKLAF
jgi:tRNA U34 5-carboxymethylaminomethyl modifying GTPase MnmE/TrmE